MRRICSLVAVVVIASALAGCTRRALGPGEARLTISSGKAQVAATGEPWHAAHSDQRLHRGDRVKVLSGLAQVQFSGSRSLELRSGSEVHVLAQPEVLQGDVLATAKDSLFTVNAGTAEARLRHGAAHVARGLGATAASYSGDVVVSSAGRDLTVPALRQAAVAGPGLVPSSPTPLDYQADNPWDRRYLGEAIELGDELQSRSQGFTAQLAPDEGHTAGFYRVLIPALDKEPGFTPALLQPNMTPGETLVGAAITVEGKEGDFTNRWQSVFSFRNQGARWGLVALDQKVSRGPLLSEVDEALGRRSATSAVAAPAAPAGGSLPSLLPSAPTSAAPPTGGGGGDNGFSGGGGGTNPRPSPTTTAPPVTTPPGLPPILGNPGGGPGSPPTSTPGSPLEGLIQGVGGTVGGLLGGLLSPRT